MPGFNGKGPQGTGPMSGRGCGRCWSVDAPALGPVSPVQQVNEGSETAITQGSVQNIPAYGRGRGGVPCGCGRGFGFGGGRRLRR